MCPIEVRSDMLTSLKVIVTVTGSEKNMQPDRGSNPGPFDHKANALPTELTPPHILSTR